MKQLETSPVELTKDQLGQVAGGSNLNVFLSSFPPPVITKVTGQASNSNGNRENFHSHLLTQS
jgi:hypothetical protein